MHGQSTVLGLFLLVVSTFVILQSLGPHGTLSIRSIATRALLIVDLVFPPDFMDSDADAESSIGDDPPNEQEIQARLSRMVHHRIMEEVAQV